MHKILTKIVLHGSRQSKSTGWRVWPGFTTAHFSDKTSERFPDGTSINQVLDLLTLRGDDVSALMSIPESLLGYPPKPEAATEYQHGWSYDKPVSLGEWSWSSTFGRWGRVVTFSDGWTGFTWPKTW